MKAGSQIFLAVVKRGNQYELCVRRFDQTTFEQLTPVFAAAGGVILAVSLQISSAPAEGESSKTPNDAGASELEQAKGSEP
jgi:hypothetical protein